jgi:site-specific DNA recombinase
MKETAIIYARVSTQDQAEHGISLDAQVARCAQYVEARGLTLTDTIIDAGLSAKNVSGRPGLTKILGMIQRREIQHVVTLKLDRLSRNTVEALQMVALMAKRGCDLHLVAEAGELRSDSADDEFLLTLKCGLAQRERKVIGERTKLALDRKRERGEFCGGEAPYGFEAIDGRLISSIQEQAVILKIRNLRKKGYSVRRIVICLREDGHLNRSGQPFLKTQVQRIVAREAA